jgi:beta-glucosidase
VKTVATLILAVGVALPIRAQLPYRDSLLPVEQRVRDLLGRMTLEEKFWQLYMIPGGLEDRTHDYSKGVFGLQNRSAATARADAELHNRLQRFFVDSTRLGIPIIPFEEAVHGIMRRGAAVYPQAIGLAATFDSALVERVAADMARDARARGIRQVLSPVVNIATDVRWGRVEETYGEDPYLASVMARVFVRAFERRGVIATPKHFVANVGEGGRDSYPIEASRRLLEELHFPPFRSAIRDAGARSIMTSYNSVDGSPASQSSDLLSRTLKGEWGFTGFVISDQAAVGGATVLHMTEASTATATKHALESGLDVIFQSSHPQHRSYLDAFRRGLIADSVIDAGVARVLRAKFELGLFERPFVALDSAVETDARVRALMREAARASLVLLRNEGTTLPLARTAGTVAVIGTDAAEARLGGYTMDEATGISVLAALRERLGERRVLYAPGPGREGSGRSLALPGMSAGEAVSSRRARSPLTVPAASFTGLRGEYWDNNRLEGTPRLTRDDALIDFRWTLNSPARGIPFDWYSVRWTGRLRVPDVGVRRIGVEGNDGYRLYLDGKLLIDNWRKQSFRLSLADVALAPGSVHDVRLEYFESTGNARVKLVWDAGPMDDSEAAIDSAVAVARRSDVAIIVAGIEEGEFRDRARLALPGRQEELILRVAATGKPVVVVLIGGSAVTMSSWIDRVGAVLAAWYPGEEGGRAIADVLYGDANPAGRLPITFPLAEGQLPLTYNHKPTGRGDDYVDLTGHPAFPFGFGLTYTTFEYSALRIEPAEIGAEGRVVIRFRVRNSGTRAGDEVPQLYVRDVLASVARPIMELKGFTRLRLEPGEAREVAFTLDASDLRMLDERMRWIVEPGIYRVMVGTSSRDIRLRGELTAR